MPETIPAKIWCFTDTTHHDTYPAINPTSAAASYYAGKAVLITGANKGLGRAYTIAYARAGISYIVIASRTDASSVATAALEAAAEANRSPPPMIMQARIDVCDEASVNAAAAQVQSEIGRLDFLVNNAGYMGPEGKLLDQSSDEYLHTFDVSFSGTYRVTKAFLPLMLQCGGDKTVVIATSVGAHSIECAAAYSIAKFALCRFSQFLVEEYGEQGVLSYAYHPGGIVTDLASNLPDHIKIRLNDTAELASHTLVYLTREKRIWLGGRYISANWDMPELIASEERIVQSNLLKFRCAVE